jgi:putative MATE family efflux protein
LSHDLTTGPVGAHLRRQATPMALGLVAIISFDAVDLFFVSRLGESHLAAMSFCFPAIWLLTSFNIGFEAGAASTISRAVGAGELQGARRLTTDAAVLAGLVSICLALLGLVTIPLVFPLLGAEAGLLPLISDYMSIWYWAVPAASVYWVCLASMRARGNTMLEGKIIALAALLNMALDPILIFGLFGFPRLEIAGAALATLVSNLLVLVGTLAYLHFRLDVLASPLVPWRKMLASWRRVLAVGLPATLTNTIVPISNSVIVALVATHGASAVAGLGVAMRIEPVALIAFYALSAVSSPVMGQNFGAGRFDRLDAGRVWIGRFSILFGLLLALLFTLVATPLSALFTELPATLEVATTYLWILPFSYGGYGMVMCACASFNGLGHPGPAVVLSALRALLVLMPLALLGQWLLGLPGLFVGAALSNLLVGTFGYVWLGRKILQLQQ